MKGIAVRLLIPITVGVLWAIGPVSAADDQPRREEIIVETSRAELAVIDMPTNTSVLDQDDIQKSAAMTVDAVLRQIPGFSLLRSADSIATSPTTSTVSLRGLGGSAASRTLILLDGMPIHSPYSSEVYWARIPRHRIERVEVVRGGGANSWGNLSLGGVVNVISEQPREGGLDITGSIGYPETVDLNVYGSQVTDNWSFSGGVTYFDTEGYMTVPDELQGPIDEEVRKDFGIVSGKVAYDISDNASIYVNGSWFEENRTNGSPMDVNETEIWTLGTGLNLESRDGSQWALSMFYDDSDLTDASTSINDDRDEERLRSTRQQPTTALGTSLVWSRKFAEKHTLTAGADYRWTDMQIDEFGRFQNGMPRELKVTTGNQDMGGFYLQDAWEISDRWRVIASARYDYVTNNGALEITDLTTGLVDINETYADNSENTVNPSLGIRYQAAEWASLRAAVYKGFRAPTMRELYRTASTRGGVILVNNPQLAPETLLGIEAGTDFLFDNGVTLRLTIFQNTVEDLIQNITRGVAGDTPTVIPPCGLIDAGDVCRELANVGEMEAIGFELESEYRPNERWSFFVSYLYNDTDVTEAPDNPQIIGKQIRQAPKNSFTANIRNSNRWFDTALQGRYVGARYEDDLNTLRVDEFFLLDLVFSRDLSESTEIFLGIDNVFDEEYDIRVDNDGFNEIGRPRFVNLGLRYRH